MPTVMRNIARNLFNKSCSSLQTAAILAAVIIRRWLTEKRDKAARNQSPRSEGSNLSSDNTEIKSLTISTSDAGK